MKTIKWVDRGRDPQSVPDPRYPFGVGVDVSFGATKTCEVQLPYPAARIRCGSYTVICEDCGQRVLLTTTGRADDPRAVKMACKPKSQPH